MFYRSLLLIPLTIFTACNSLGNKKENITERGKYEERNSTGCVQGVIIDGQTNERIDIKNRQDGEGIFVQYQRRRINATRASKQDYMQGEYVICGVPLDESYPIFARFSGYQEYYSHVYVESTVAQKSPRAEVDIRKPKPTLIANIRLYPKGVDTKDLSFEVLANGTPVAEAIVRLTPQGRSYFDRGDFLAPMNFRAQSLSLKTDANGKVTFSKDQLMLGGSYRYEILPPDGGASLGAKSSELTVGLNGGANIGSSNPYEIRIDLSQSRSTEVAIVSSSLDSQDYNDKGRITLILNRDIEIVPGTNDKQTAFLSNAVQAKIRDNIPGNDHAEQLNLAIEGNKLVIEPSFATIPDVAIERGLKITYSGIMVQPVTSPGTTTAKDLGNLTVSVFSGDASPDSFKVATTLEQTNGNDQTGLIGKALGTNLRVRVYDQFGEPFSGQKVVFNLENDNDGGSLSTYAPTTNAMGYAEVEWTLGLKVGTQSVTANATSVHGQTLAGSPLTFTANATEDLAPTSIAIWGGDNQTGVVGTQLADPIKIRVVDQNGDPIAGQTVEFLIDSGNNGGSVLASSTSNSEGIVETAWTLGTKVGTQTLTVRANSASGPLVGAPLTISATAQATPDEEDPEAPSDPS